MYNRLTIPNTKLIARKFSLPKNRQSLGDIRRGEWIPVSSETRPCPASHSVFHGQLSLTELMIMHRIRDCSHKTMSFHIVILCPGLASHLGYSCALADHLLPSKFLENFSLTWHLSWNTPVLQPIISYHRSFWGALARRPWLYFHSIKLCSHWYFETIVSLQNRKVTYIMTIVAIRFPQEFKKIIIWLHIC